MENNKQIIARLANGDKLRFPEGTSQEVVDKAVQQHLIGQNASQIKAPLDLPWYEDALDWTKKNMELPMGIGGSLGGALVGTLFGGPVGTVVGGIAGGAVGSGAGSVTSDVLEDVPIDYADALKEAAISAGIDVVTLGTGSKIKSFIAARKALGVSPEDTARQLIQKAQEGMPTGSQESLRATQKLLQEGGATLLPSQTKQATALQEFSESIAQIGILSGASLAENSKRVNAVIEDNLNRIIERSSVGALDSAALGQELNSVISAGRQAMISSYGNSLDEIIPAIKRGSVSTKPLKNRLQAFRRTYVTRELVDGKPVEAVSNLSPQTASFMGEINEILRLPALSGDSLIALDKRVTQKVTDIAEGLGKAESGVATSDLRQLTALSETLKEGIQKAIGSIDPKAADDYRELKRAYSENMSGLLPTINASMLKGIASGRKGTEVLGRMLVTASSPEKIEAFMKSIDTAYAKIGKENAEELTFRTAEDAKQAIRASFLEKTFNLSASESKDFSEYAKKIGKWGSKDGKRSLTAVFGKDATRVQQIFNMLTETASKTDSNFLGLSIRGKEVGAAGQVIGAGFSGALGAVGILGLPVVLARAATNPKTTNKLLAFEKRKFSSEDAKQAAAAIILSDILETVPDSEKEDFKLKIQLEEDR